MARGVVVTYSVGATGSPDGHEASTRKEIARRLAVFMGCAYEGEYDALRHYATPLYFVPGDTLTSETASRLGVCNERDLYGGVVRHPFVATKAITHPLLEVASYAPAGWCAEFPRSVAGVVLDGVSVFAKKMLWWRAGNCLNSARYASSARLELADVANPLRTMPSILPVCWMRSTRRT